MRAPSLPHRALAFLALLGAIAASCKSAGQSALAEAKANAPGLELRFEGNATFDRSRLLDAIALDLRDLSSDGIDRPDVDDLAYALEIFYRQQGFPDAYVAYQLGSAGEAAAGDGDAGAEQAAEGDGAARQDQDHDQDAGAGRRGDGDGPGSRQAATSARFFVEEGRRARVDEFVLSGNETNVDPAFEPERVLPFFSPPTGVFGEQPWWFVRGDLEGGAAALAEFYRAKGFLDVVVAPPDVRWQDAERTRARVEVHVDEGPRWVLDEVLLDTPPELPDERRRVLARLLEQGRRDDEGRLLPYTLRLAYGLRARLLERFGEWGHPDAACAIEETALGDGRMRVRFRVRPGPRVRINEVIVRGNDKTRTSFVRNRLTLEPGEVVDSRELRASFARLFETGLFRTVTIQLAQPGQEAPPPPGEGPPADAAGARAPTEEADGAEAAGSQGRAGGPPAEGANPGQEGAPDDAAPTYPAEVRRDLVVEVLELPSLEATVEPGYGSYEGARLRLGLEDANVFGTGRTAEIETTVSALAQKVTLGLGDRALFDSDYAGSSAIYFDRREEPSFTLQERGFALNVSRAWRSRSLEASLGYRFRRTEVSDVEVVDDLVEDALSEIDISSIALTVGRDTRNRFFAPSDGSFVRAQLEWASAAFGSEVDFVSGRLEASSFRALPWQGGVLATGIETGLIAPVGSTQVIPLQVRLFNGGENTVRSFPEDELGNLDENGEPIGGEAYSVVSVELRQHVAGPVSTALFYDAGNLEPDHEQYLDFDDMRQAIGVGLRYALPIGPVRLDAGWNPDDRQNEEDWVVHLSVGLSF